MINENLDDRGRVYKAHTRSVVVILPGDRTV